MDISHEALRLMWTTMHATCRQLGIAVITGHTGRYENCHYPMVGGATVVGTGALDRYVSPGFIKPGDKIIITKGPAIEACGILATMFPKLLQKNSGLSLPRRPATSFTRCQP